MLIGIGRQGTGLTADELVQSIPLGGTDEEFLFGLIRFSAVVYDGSTISLVTPGVLPRNSRILLLFRFSQSEWRPRQLVLQSPRVPSCSRCASAYHTNTSEWCSEMAAGSSVNTLS